MLGTELRTRLAETVESKPSGVFEGAHGYLIDF
jgi:hypothetical protein